MGQHDHGRGNGEAQQGGAHEEPHGPPARRLRIRHEGSVRRVDGPPLPGWDNGGMPPSALPDGDPAPSTGELPAAALADLGAHRPRHLRPRAVLHGALRLLRLQHLHADRARRSRREHRRRHLRRRGRCASSTSPGSVLGDEAPAVSTVFVGGGTPTMLRSGDLVTVLDGIRERFGLAPDAEVTTEANPDSVTPESLRELADGRLHAGLGRHAVGRAPRARARSSAPTTPTTSRAPSRPRGRPACR